MTCSDLIYSSCVKENIDPDSVIAFFEALKKKNIEMHSIVMIRNNKVVMEANWSPYSASTPHVVNSVTKTFISVGIGMLYDRGLVRLNDPIVSYFPEIPIDERNQAIKMVTLKNVLTMSMGQDVTPAVDNERDWVQALLNNPLTFKPGSKFHYDSLATFMLSAIFKKVAGVKISSYLREHLFAPLGIEQAYFLENHDDITIGGLGLFIPTIGLAKTGLMLLNKGVYNDKRILSKEWAEMTLAKQIDNADQFAASKTESREGYGFQCWHCTHGGIRMSGLWGQICLMLPEKNTVIAFNARGSSSQPVLDEFWPTLFEGISDSPVGEASQAKLEAYLKQLKVDMIKGTAHSEMEKLASGKPVAFCDNIYGLQSASLNFSGDTLELEVTRNGKKYAGSFRALGYFEGHSNLYRMFPPYYDSLAPNLPDNFKEPAAFGSFAWLDEANLLLSMRYDNEATDYQIKLHFDYEYIGFEWAPKTIFTRYEHVVAFGRYRELNEK